MLGSFLVELRLGWALLKYYQSQKPNYKRETLKRLLYYGPVEPAEIPFGKIKLPCWKNNIQINLKWFIFIPEKNQLIQQYSKDALMKMCFKKCSSLVSKNLIFHMKMHAFYR